MGCEVRLDLAAQGSVEGQHVVADHSQDREGEPGPGGSVGDRNLGHRLARQPGQVRSRDFIADLSSGVADADDQDAALLQLSRRAIFGRMELSDA